MARHTKGLATSRPAAPSGCATGAHHAPWVLNRRPPSVQVLAGGWNAGQVVVVGATCLGRRLAFAG